ncbi:MAG: hypothetical protein Q8P18_11375 [Pseudomonadota bacterium]|nr:hypothetical protein [Pseudomonadota bacterium]
MILLALLGCLDRLLESPYVLATGLGDVRSVAPSTDGRLWVAASTGVYAIDGEGRAERIEEAPALAVASHPDRTYVLRDGRVTWGGGAGLDAPGAVDILGGHDALVVLYPDHYERIGPGDPSGAPRHLARLGGTLDARAVALGPDGGWIVVSEHALQNVGADGAVTTVIDGLVDARAAVVDVKGRIYVAQGDPQELWRVDPGAPSPLVSVARWLGDPKDLHFGVGGLLATENTYVANGAGTLEYVRPPP